MFGILRYKWDGFWSYNPNMRQVYEEQQFGLLIFSTSLHPSPTPPSVSPSFSVSPVYLWVRRQVFQYWYCSDVTVFTVSSLTEVSVSAQQFTLRLLYLLCRGRMMGLMVELALRVCLRAFWKKSYKVSGEVYSYQERTQLFLEERDIKGGMRRQAVKEFSC